MSRKTFDALYEKHAKDTETKPSSSNKSLLSSIGDHFDDRANQVNQEYNLGSPADDLTPEEDYIDAFGKAAVTDMATSVGEWAKNAPKNYAGAWKARNKVLEEHPLAAIDEDVLDTSNAPAPTKEQLQTVTDYEEAMSKLNDETVRPAVTVAAVLGVPGGTFAYMPYMAKDILDTYGREVEEKGFKEGMISGTLTNAKEITIGNMWYYLTDKEFNERIKEDPSLLKDVLLEAADVGAGVRTAVHPMVRRVSNKVKLKAEQSKLIKDIVKEIKEGISDESSRNRPYVVIKETYEEAMQKIDWQEKELNYHKNETRRLTKINSQTGYLIILLPLIIGVILIIFGRHPMVAKLPQGLLVMVTWLLQIFICNWISSQK